MRILVVVSIKREYAAVDQVEKITAVFRWLTAHLNVSPPTRGRVVAGIISHFATAAVGSRLSSRWSIVYLWN